MLYIYVRCYLWSLVAVKLKDPNIICSTVTVQFLQKKLNIYSYFSCALEKVVAEKLPDNVTSAAATAHPEQRVSFITRTTFDKRLKTKV